MGRQPALNAAALAHGLLSAAERQKRRPNRARPSAEEWQSIAPGISRSLEVSSHQ